LWHLICYYYFFVVAGVAVAVGVEMHSYIDGCRSSANTGIGAFGNRLVP
jgi:hypothetical protein